MTGQREDDHAARIIAGVPEGLDALVLAQLVNEAQSGSAPGALLHVARDDRRLEALEQALSFFAPQMRVITFPAWDTVPYDRVGPHSDIVARRMATLAKLALATRKHPTIVLTTVNAILQRVPARSFMKRTIKPLGARPAHRHGAPDAAPRADGLHAQRHRHGAGRVRRARRHPRSLSAGAHRARYASTSSATRWRPSRPSTCRRSARPSRCRSWPCMPVSEVAFGEEAEKLFRARYVELFGGATSDDPLYEAVSAGHRYPGQEHWLPLFHDHLETLFDYLPGVPVSFDHRSRRIGQEPLRADRRALRGAPRSAGGAQVRRAALQAGAGRTHVPRSQIVRGRAGRPALVPPDAVRGRRGPRTCALGAGAAGAPSPPSASRATSTCSTPSSATSAASRASRGASSSRRGRPVRASGWRRC